MDSKSDVIQGLLHSSKGNLNYKKHKDGSKDTSEISYLPPWSKGISTILEKKISALNVSGEVSQSDETDFVPDHGQAPIDDCSVMEDFSSVMEDTSIIDEHRRYLLVQERSLDDDLMKETGDRVEQNLNRLKEDYQRVDKQNADKKKSEEEERQRKLKQIQEAERLEEIRNALYIQEWKHRTLETYMAEDERVEAALRSAEQQTKKITIQREEERRKAILNSCKECQKECHLLIHHVNDCKESCKYPQHLHSSVVHEFGNIIQKIKAIYNELEKATDTLNAKQINNCQDQLKRFILLLEYLRKAVHEANQIGTSQLIKEQKEAQQKEALRLEMEKKAKEKEEEEKQKNRLNAQSLQPKAVEANQTISAPGSVDHNMDLGMPKSMVPRYTKLQDMLSTTSLSTNSLSTSQDPSTKKYRFELQKNINIIVNSVSANSGEGLIDKISKLKNLMGGKTMGKSVSISQHPEAKLYCYNLFSRKLVKQGEDQVASNIEAAFPLAAVSIGLWSNFPEIGDHMLAHFHSICPILVPLYVKKSGDMTDVEHMKLQGYRISSDGVVETDDMFLHRMRGIVRLYAAIISTPQLPFEQVQHPHSLEYGWAWLSRILNMEPHPTLTAAALGDFLEIAGHALMRKFGRQFKKLLYILCKDYVPKMKKCTPQSQKGPLSRLIQFLEECNSSGSFAEPKGYLQRQFWRTRSKGIALA